MTKIHFLKVSYSLTHPLSVCEQTSIGINVVISCASPMFLFFIFIFNIWILFIYLRIQILRPGRPLNHSNMNLCLVVEIPCVPRPRLVESVLEHIKVFGINHDPWKVIPRSRPSVVKGVLLHASDIVFWLRLPELISVFAACSMTWMKWCSKNVFIVCVEMFVQFYHCSPFTPEY